MNEISYHRKNDEIECVRYKNSTKCYAPHTHAGHLTLGYVEDGEVCIVMNGKAKIYRAGEQFKILPDVLHEIKTVDGKPYSMAVTCILFDKEDGKSDTNGGGNYGLTGDIKLIELKSNILDKPENVYLIEEMAADSNISPFHLIRKFKKAFGLTPHQFQIQCKVRKAQKLLEESKSVCEVTYDAGFCDQSHLDRCFQKVVGLTPKEYKASVQPNPESSSE